MKVRIVLETMIEIDGLTKYQADQYLRHNSLSNIDKYIGNAPITIQDYEILDDGIDD